jgi:hypothetical protein
MAVLALCGAAVLWMGVVRAQAPAAQAQPQGAPPAPAQPGRGAPGRGPSVTAKKHVLVIGMTLGYHHGSTSDGMAMFWELGKESGVYDAELRTDMKWVTNKQPGEGETHPLSYFDAIVFVNCTSVTREKGGWNLDAEQKQALLSFVHDDGKGLIAAHASLDANYDWPEWAEMVGGWFGGHPWGTFNAPVIVEDQTFPAMRHFPKYLRLVDEMYSPREWSRDKVNVLMRLDESKLDYTSPQPGGKAGAPVGRPDKDQAIAWSKMYGKGRVFYSSLGHTKEAFADPDVRKMYLESVKWVLGKTEGSVTPHPKVN